jgi:serine/threonine protein kinase
VVCCDGAREKLSLWPAVKVLDVSRSLGFSEEDAVRAFYWEGLNLALVDHPNIVELVGVCVDAATSFRAILLEFCDGGDLKAPRHAPAPDVWRWGVQLADALRYLHASGQVHRDVKSENVLLAEAGCVAKFADLGVADADEEFVGDKLGSVHGFNQKDVRWAAPEEIAAMLTEVRAGCALPRCPA